MSTDATYKTLSLSTDPDIVQLIMHLKEKFSLPENIINFSVHFHRDSPVSVDVSYYPQKVKRHEH